MKMINGVLDGREATKLVHYNDLTDDFPNTVYFDDLPNKPVNGVLKASMLVDGRLRQVYSLKENHVGVIAATRLGKTTSYVIPTIISFAKQQVKRNMVISDPKGEVYQVTASVLREEGYDVKLINFRDYLHSELWNPLTPIYRAYRQVQALDKEVTVINTPDGPRQVFKGRRFASSASLKKCIAEYKRFALAEVGGKIDALVNQMIPLFKRDDPFWEQSARSVLKALIWAMLEDSDLPENPLTEEQCSISTALTIIEGISFSEGVDDKGFFTARSNDSMAYILFKQTILENANNTRMCIIAQFSSSMAVYRESTVRFITCTNSIDMTDLTGDKPIAIYIDYRDESKDHYGVIASLVQEMYNYLIEYATTKSAGKLNRPFYFILDEFGNFPPIKDFETVISACGGRNIYFILILQSYAQLENVYDKATAEIIRDNLNMHVFMGSNNPDTLAQFAAECGEFSRISPHSALNGAGERITSFQLETLPLIPKSTLAKLGEGECIVTEAQSGYVMMTKLERYFKCKQLESEPTDSGSYQCRINPLDEKFSYRLPKRRFRRPTDDFDF